MMVSPPLANAGGGLSRSGESKASGLTGTIKFRMIVSGLTPAADGPANVRETEALARGLLVGSRWAMSHTTCFFGVSDVAARIADLLVDLAARRRRLAPFPPFRRVSLAIPLANTGADLGGRASLRRHRTSLAV